MNVAISKKREFMKVLPEESAPAWSYEVRSRLVERVIALVKGNNLEQAIRIMDTLTRVSGRHG